ncbi:MAG TPA: 3'-5' exonuclease, partial [Isosphaeraceae bacterium]|nr:3'-5' exonuclease [Isosphaeraceae bacterium]
LGITPERIDSLISRAKNDLITPDRFGAWREPDPITKDVTRVFQEYQKRLRESSAVDFDDLLVHVVTILKNNPDVRASLDSRFQYVLVDEYQDTNLAQYAIVRAISTDQPNLCVTGDPDQSIYGWRGANLNNILDFEHDFPGCRVVRLEQNYRSTKNILAVADQLIRFNERRKAKALTTENPHGELVELVVYGSETDEAQGVAAKISSLVSDGPYSFRDIAVFCRVTALTRNLESAFRAAGIPYQVVGGTSFYERQEVKDVLAYLNLLANPRDDVSFLRVVNVPPRGIGKTTLDHLAAFGQVHELPLLATAREAATVPGVKDRAVRSLRDFVRLIDELAPLRDLTAAEAIRRLLDRTGYREYLDKEGQAGEDRRANVDELITAARQFDDDHPGGSVVEFLEDTSLASAVDRWNDEAGAVALMTLHAAKGLEFPVVFIIGLEQGLLPHSLASKSESQIEEERRLLFVGITRAQKELILSYCRMRKFRGLDQTATPSRFINEFPDDPMRVRDVSRFNTSGSFTGLKRTDDDNGWYPRVAPSPAPPSTFRLITAAELAGASAPTSASSPELLNAIRPGVAVTHPQYGLGRVIAIEGAGPSRKGRIAFVLGGERTFVLAKAPLRLVSRD